jgi:hypothetical protein
MTIQKNPHLSKSDYKKRFSDLRFIEYWVG